MPQIAQPLSRQLTKRLLAYTTVAGAAAACAAHAQAEVVYTPIDRPVHSNFYIDLNHDGIDDFHIYSSLLSGSGKVQVFPADGNRVVPDGSEGCFASQKAAAPLPAGTVIGPGKPFQASATCMAYLPYGASFSYGPWKEVKHRYLGLAFSIHGKVHFGWARLSLYKFLFNNTARIEGYAYETVPGKPIVAGDEGNSAETSARPASLGALAAGAPALNSPREDKGEQ
jgi:hypothetical protein